MHLQDGTICAISSPAGVGAISVIRLSGNNAHSILASVTSSPDKFTKLEPYKAFYTKIIANNSQIIDDVIVLKFSAPASFTGEDMAEIYCHGSVYVQKEIMNLLIEKGANTALPGEFTKRAFLNGKMDLSQSEAVADIISSNSAESHRIAVNQLKGGISNEINVLRSRMIDLTALMELELDFGEEDVEFADRTQILNLIGEIKQRVNQLIESFRYGNAIKNGVPVAIVGEPNTGKSTLLNALLNDERAIVSAIPGTTRDTIEEEIMISGIRFRIIDTAGLRQGGDEIEEIGIQRSFDKIQSSQLILLVVDVNQTDVEAAKIVDQISDKLEETQKLMIVFNKSDISSKASENNEFKGFESVCISAKERVNLDILRNKMTNWVNSLKTGSGDVIISSVRHTEMLNKSYIALERAADALNSGLSGDLVSQDLREAMHYLGEITGQVSNEEVLGAIFAKFCIGK
ncbi:MAG: tRNA uridine-5-carboxymethylaminomethyl(34) synthesis GTPase MnmE [Bacteroidales bacterium]|nr:tRNA uridine-5-carboxymethylaminomethyl(34) synthesis GTPase MnmE [Bacteroidales bacterium]